MLSIGAVDGNGAFTVNFSGRSTTGSLVYFNTSEPLVTDDTDASIDIYQRRASDDTVKRISVGAVNGNGAFNSAFERASEDGTGVRVHHRRATRQRRHRHRDRHLPALRRRHEADLDRGDQRQRRLPGPDSRAPPTMPPGLLQRPTSSSSPPTRTPPGSLRALRHDDVARLGRTDQRQQKLQRLLRRRLRRRLAGLLRDRRSSSSPPTRTTSSTSTSARAARRSGSRPDRSTATSAPAPTSSAPRPTARRSSSRPSEQLVADDTDPSIDIYRRAGGATSRISVGQINGNERQGRQLQRHLRGRVDGSSSRPASSSSPPIPTAPTTSTSAPAGRRD